MIIASLKLDLYLPGSVSLKNKRRLIKSLQDKMKNKFNLAVAETDKMDNKQQAVLAAVSVSNSGKYLEKMFAQVINLVDEMAGIELMKSEINYH